MRLARVLYATLCTGAVVCGWQSRRPNDVALIAADSHRDLASLVDAEPPDAAIVAEEESDDDTEATSAAAGITLGQPLDDNGIRETVCRGRHPCRLIDTQRQPPNVVATIALTDPSDAGPDCQIERWLLHGKKRITRAQLLLAERPCGYSFGGRVVELTTKTLTIEPYGNWTGIPDENGSVWVSNWRALESYTMSLWPPQIVVSEVHEWHQTQQCHFSHTRFDWNTFQGTRKASYTAVHAANPRDDDVCQATESVVLPIVRLPNQFRVAYGRFSLGKCSVYVDGKANGYALEGRPAPSSASFRAVVHPMKRKGARETSELFVEIQDDIVTPLDELTLWTGSPPPWFETGAESVTVHVADGSVVSDPARILETASLKVAADGTRHLRIVTKESLFGFTLVFSDSDDGVNVQRRIATSRLVAGNEKETLGTYFNVGRATCVIDGDHLEPATQTSVAPTESFLLR